jgi:hypothetical protein
MRGISVRPCLYVLLVALAAALVFGVGQASAATVNLVPNPGFETGPCGFQGPIICDWFAFPNVTMTQDFSNPHSGLASMNLSGPPFELDASTSGSGFPGCRITHPGPHPGSFWYRTTDFVATVIALVAHWWPSNNCSGAAPSGEIITNSPTTDGAWHQVIGTMMAPPFTGSVSFGILEGCSIGCTAPLNVNFDDLDVEGHVRKGL